MCFFVVSFTKAQTCSIVFTSSDTSLYFTTKLNDKIQNSVFVNNIRLTGIEANNKYLARIKLKNDTTELRQTIFLLDAGFTHFYEIDKKGVHLKKIAPTLNEEPDPNQYLVVCDGFNRPIEAPIKNVIDTSKTDTTYFEDHYEMPDYNGKIGCPYPLKEEEFNGIFLELKQKSLEDDRLAFIKEQFNNTCITSEQLSLLFGVFEFEETKLDFGLFIYPFIFDIDRFFDVAKNNLKYESHLVQIKETYKVD